ncbi:hypothetical protein Ndes2526B_g06972 [Nannochloris sp. 'desiccata']|nr:hypothetical protein KSW81_004946 [Chlorella desiccata (nom. nud.)]KAH7618070.1 putative Phospholipid phosphatase 3 [Chlorella desiccata (nom. nud.)]
MRENGQVPQNEQFWKFRSIQWKQVIRRQDHANLILTLGLIIAVTLVSFLSTPRQDVFYIYDATISNPDATKHGFEPTVPNWVAVVIPILMMILTIVVGEFFYSKKQHHSITDAVAVTLYFLLDAFQSFLCAVVVTQATKYTVGRLRPDFLPRCNPIPPANVVIQFGQDTRNLYPCTNTDEDVINEGRLSFPSGHTSLSFNVITYASAYLIWCFHMRREWVPRCKGPRDEFLSDLKNVIAKLWMLVMLALAWGISMSRIIDNQHHPSDVVAGMVLGVLIAIMYIMRAVPRYARVLTSTCVACEEMKTEERVTGGVTGEMSEIEVEEMESGNGPGASHRSKLLSDNNLNKES